MRSHFTGQIPRLGLELLRVLFPVIYFKKNTSFLLSILLSYQEAFAEQQRTYTPFCVFVTLLPFGEVMYMNSKIIRKS